MSQPSRLMVMAGGTGGHVFPALAVAKHLQSHGTHITWLGTRRGLEAKVIPANDIAIEWITIEGLRGKGFASVAAAPFKLLKAMLQSAQAIRRVKPDCILGMGGFVAGPGGLVARLMGRPLIIHEQNAVAGLTNKYLAKVANRVLTGFPNVEGLPAHAVWVGNPVRESISSIGEIEQAHSDKINVLIVGGSQGAQSLNEKLPKVFSQLTDKAFSIWHQSGRDRAAMVIDAYNAEKLEARVDEFIEDMAGAYRWADLLICRAGAMTIAECCAAAKPALLIPYPFSAGDHQVKNAQVMVNVGAGKMLANEQLDKPEMLTVLDELLTDKADLHAMGQRALDLYKPHALSDVAAICQEYLDA